MTNKIFLARLLGPANFGIYVILFKICEVAGMLSLLGTNIVIVKLVGIHAGAKDWGKLKGILQSVTKIVFLSSIAMVLVIYAIKQPISSILFKSDQLCKIVFFLVAIIPLQNSLLIIKETFRGWQDLKTASFLPVLQQLTFFILITYLSFQLIPTIQNILTALIIGISFSLTVGLLLLLRKLPKGLHAQPIKSLKILKESLPMMITRGSLLVITSMDIYVLGIYTDPSEVGIYGIVSSLAALIVFSLGIINEVTPSMIAHYNAQKDFKTMGYIIRFTSTLGALFSIPVLILLFLFGEQILSILMGSQYANGVIVLKFLAMSQLINAITGSCGYLLQMTGHHMVLMKISIFCGILNLFLNIFLVQHFGKEGVAAATAFSITAQSTITMLVAYRKTGILSLASIKMLKEIFIMVRRYI